MARRKNRAANQWRTMDLHIHTPASDDYQEKGVGYLELLKQAETQGIDIIAFTDHNTVAGYRLMQEEIQELELLDKLKRLLPDEQTRLKEYQRLLDKMLVLPGFEFTATFGFHILGVFPPEKSIREIEHLLLTLRIPPELLDKGSATVGATSDVLTAYQVINEAGGLAMAAHANSTNGVAMRGFNFGGQTKIAYTQDPHLHALEVTDLGKVLDPLADQVMHVTIFVCLAWEHLMPIPMLLVILYRESIVGTLRTVCAFRSVVISARTSGKMKTASMAVGILIVLLLRTLESVNVVLP